MWKFGRFLAFLRIESNYFNRTLFIADPDGYEFYIVSLDNKQWHFEAANSEERDEWVFIIEQEIFKSLQGNESLKPKTQNSGDVALLMQNIRTTVPGNGFCVDCDSPSELKIYCRYESEF